MSHVHSSFYVSVLLSSLGERFCVSRMLDFLEVKHLYTNVINVYKQQLVEGLCITSPEHIYPFKNGTFAQKMTHLPHDF